MLNSLQQAHQSLVSFESSGVLANLDNANTYLDSAASAVPHIHAPVTTDDLSGIGAAASAYRDAVEGFAAKLMANTTRTEQQAAAVEATLAKLGKTIEAEQAKVSSLVADYQSQFSAGQTSRVEEWAKSEAAQKEKFAKQIEGFSEDFRKVQFEREKTFDALINDFSEKLEIQKDEFSTLGQGARDAYVAEIEELRKDFAVEASKILGEVKSKKDEVETLVGIIGNLGVSSGYQKTANQARNTQIFWQGATVAALLGVIAVALYSFIPPIVKGEHIPWEVLTARLLMIATVGILAAYSSSQGDKQHQIEKRNRQLALEFEALGAFLAPLPSDQQHKFRYEIGERSFGRWDDEKGHERSRVTLLDLLAELQKKDPGFVEKAREAFGTLLDKTIRKP
jgi:hypothetical protein